MALSKARNSLSATLTAFGRFEEFGYIRIEHLDDPNWLQVLARNGFDISGCPYVGGHVNQEKCYIVKVTGRWLWDHDFLFIPLFGGTDKLMHKDFNHQGKKICVKYIEEELAKKLWWTRHMYESLFPYQLMGNFNVGYHHSNLRITLFPTSLNPPHILASNPEELLRKLVPFPNARNTTVLIQNVFASQGVFFPDPNVGIYPRARNWTN